MKIFLTTCIAAMISAGIYGTVDLANDIHNNTYIQYDEGNENVTTHVASQKSISNVLRKARHEVIEVNEERIVPTLNMEDFSRSGPVFSDERLLEEMAETDSAIAMIDSAALAANEHVTIEPSKPQPDSIAEKRKFDISLYSRGRPRKVRTETVAVQTDSIKK